MLRAMKRGWMLVAAVLMVGCGGGSHERDAGAEDALLDVRAPLGPADAADATSGLPDTFDPFCHYDCFRGFWCADGEVWEQIHAPVPCNAWTGMCPRRMLGTCEEGCSDRVPYTSGWLPEPAWTTFCEEGEVKRVGDPCESDADCQPPEGAEPERNYLACDLATHACAAIDAPVAPSAGCTASFESLFESDRGSPYGVVSDTSCASGLCRFSVRSTAADCDRHVCALPCTDDWDCPRTYRCESFGDWTGRTLDEGPMGTHSICRSMTDADLVCR